jgi:hypothetical protein
MHGRVYIEGGGGVRIEMEFVEGKLATKRKWKIVSFRLDNWLDIDMLFAFMWGFYHEFGIL